jgi:hypothetical protein
MGPPIPDDPDQPPGPRNLVRILAETLQAHGDALGTGDRLAAQLTPRHWHGTASAGFVETGLPKIDTEWSQVAAVNRAVTERISGHSTFLQSLRVLWGSESPAERERLRVLEQQTSAKLAEELLDWAAQLDGLGHVDLADPAIAPAPSEPAPASDAVTPDRDGAADHDQQHSPTPQNGWRQAMPPYPRFHYISARLREQILAGERREHVPWTG